ncbi:MAG: bifunctional DNA-formamidopyrimidine glycosylase/DNA-(apurinic or apyrimidinic site) lyase [Patescibacteria group bacterium]
MWRKSGKVGKSSVPEFPEVYTIVTDLSREFIGCKINAVKVIDAKLVRPNVAYLKKIINTPIINITQKGKTIVFKFANEMVMTFHLRMTGRLLLGDDNSKTSPHTKIVFNIKDKKLLFNEVRKFGYCEVIPLEEFSAKFANLAPNIIDMTKEDFVKRVSAKNTIIKRALLDQTVVAGIGNIYASEGLWLAKIHPQEKTRELSSKDLGKLLTSLISVVKKGIANRGSTLGDKSFVDLYGKAGTAQNFLKVYGQVGLPCPRCKTPILVTRISQRSSYFCPKCQCP